MIVPVIRSKNYSHGKSSRRTLCNAHIPLCFLKNLSNGALKQLVERLNITTIEDLHMIKKETIFDHITNRCILKEIHDAKERIARRAKVKKHIIKFEDFAMDKNIRIKPAQRQHLIAISLFKEILTNVDEVISFVLGIHNPGRCFREQALLKSLYIISKRALKAA